jgi:hypothetical protein
MADKIYQIEVEAEPHYIAEQSNVATDVYVFGYRIRLTNTGNEPAQLISRTGLSRMPTIRSRKCVAWAWWASSPAGAWPDFRVQQCHASEDALRVDARQLPDAGG